MTEKLYYGAMEMTRCELCEHGLPQPDKDPCEFCLAQYPQGNPVGFHDHFKPKRSFTVNGKVEVKPRKQKDKQ